MIEFCTSDALMDYVHRYDKKTRHGDISIGTFEFIDSDDCHVLFMNRFDYEKWLDSRSDPVQLVLF